MASRVGLGQVLFQGWQKIRRPAQVAVAAVMMGLVFGMPGESSAQTARTDIGVERPAIHGTTPTVKPRLPVEGVITHRAPAAVRSVTLSWLVPPGNGAPLPTGFKVHLYRASRTTGVAPIEIRDVGSVPRLDDGLGTGTYTLRWSGFLEPGVYYFSVSAYAQPSDPTALRLESPLSTNEASKAFR